MPFTPDDTKEDISSHQVGRGVFWAYIAFASGKALVFVSTIILARLLTPADFGLVALASIVTEYLGTIHTFGVGQALIQRQSKIPEASNATFVFSVSSGILLFLISLALAPFAADFFNEPRVAPILPTLAFTYILSGLSSVNDALLVKQLKFQQRVIPLLVQALFKGISSILLAIFGFGAWAIVWGVVIGTAAKSVTVWIVNPWKPTRDWDWQVAKQTLSFGGHMVLLNFIGNFEDNVDYLIVGKQLGTSPLGLYTLGFRAPELIILNLASVVSDVAFPVYARIQGDLVALQRSLLKAVQLIAWVVIPAGVGLAVISNAFVRTFYTDKWADAIPVMQILSIYSAVRAITYNFGDAYKAVGRPDILNKISFATLGFTFLALWFGAKYGIAGVAWAHLIVITFLVIIETLVVWRLLKIPPPKILGVILGPSIGAGIMALSMMGVALAAHSLNVAIILALQVLAGVVTYVVAAWWLNRSVSIFVWTSVRHLFDRKTSTSRSMP